MTEEQLWERFQTSGRIADYLQLTAVRRSKEEQGVADSQGCRSDTAAGR